MWYVAIDGKQEGPMKEADLLDRIHSGNMVRDAYVYKDGMDNWQLITERQEFAAALRPPPPPPPPSAKTAPPTPPPRSTTADTFVRQGRLGSTKSETKKKRRTAKAVSAPPPEKVKIPRRYRKGFRGTVRDVQIREVTSGSVFNKRQKEYVSFRLEVTDDRGDVIDQVPVELTAENIPGRVVRDGDTAVVKGRRTRQGLVNPKAIYVVNTRAEIKVKRRHGFLATILALPLGIAFLAAWPAFVIGIVQAEEMFWLVPASIVVMFVYYFLYIR